MDDYTPEMMAKGQARMRALNEERIRELDAQFAAERAREIRLSPEDRAVMGALAKIKLTLYGDPTIEFLNHIVDFVAAERERGRTDPDPLISARALIAAQRTLIILTRNGYPKLLPLLHDVQIGVDKIGHMFRQELVRRILLNLIPEPKASEVLQELSGMVEAGQWPDWRQDWDEVEASLA